jgi:hypothetical protein
MPVDGCKLVITHNLHVQSSPMHHWSTTISPCHRQLVMCDSDAKSDTDSTKRGPRENCQFCFRNHLKKFLNRTLIWVWGLHKLVVAWSCWELYSQSEPAHTMKDGSWVVKKQFSVGVPVPTYFLTYLFIYRCSTLVDSAH